MLHCRKVGRHAHPGHAWGPGSQKSGKNIQMLMVPQNSKELLTITELCAAGKIRPLIDRVYPLKETPEAFRYILTSQAKGKIVITMPSAGV
ncbi:MAG: zinc-binding dehydrogenase [Holophaga sp.]|nr:zinc-binding dehydrogenase [Holophaga sp.]